MKFETIFRAHTEACTEPYRNEYVRLFVLQIFTIGCNIYLTVYGENVTVYFLIHHQRFMKNMDDNEFGGNRFLFNGNRDDDNDHLSNSDSDTNPILPIHRFFVHSWAEAAMGRGSLVPTTVIQIPLKQAILRSPFLI